MNALRLFPKLVIAVGIAFALAGVVAAGVAFAVHSGFDFVWHLPAIVLIVTLLIGIVLPAPITAPADNQIVPAQAKEPDENQAH